jgi:hypothetical protein
MENKSTEEGGMGINNNESQGQTERAVALQEGKKECSLDMLWFRILK